MAAFADADERHWFMITLPTATSGPGDVEVEFSDQSNTCDGPGLKDVRLYSDRLEVEFHPDAGLNPSDRDEVREETLVGLTIAFDAQKSVLGEIREVLAKLNACDCPFRDGDTERS
jgi:hypothetical protein